MREMSIASVEDGKVRYVAEDYLKKVTNSCYPWIEMKQEAQLKERLDRWNKLFGSRGK